MKPKREVYILSNGDIHVLAFYNHGQRISRYRRSLVDAYGFTYNRLTALAGKSK